MKYKHVIIFVLIILSISLTGCFLFPPINNTAEWTVMVYLDADNNLESAGIDDINEMEIVGSTSEVNIVVQVDRIPYSVLASNNEGYADDISNVFKVVKIFSSPAFFKEVKVKYASQVQRSGLNLIEFYIYGKKSTKR